MRERAAASLPFIPLNHLATGLAELEAADTREDRIQALSSLEHWVRVAHSYEQAFPNNLAR